jgi:hypothetical protein
MKFTEKFLKKKKNYSVCVILFIKTKKIRENKNENGQLNHYENGNRLYQLFIKIICQVV